MSYFAVLAIGEDHPGIVAALTSEVSVRELNIEVSRMATLGDRFSMMLVVKGDVDPEALKRKLESVHPEGKRLRVSVTPQLGFSEQPSTPPSHVISVYSAEKPGVIAALSAWLANRAINITHLHSQVLNVPDGQSRPELYCVTRAFINLNAADAAELEDELRTRLRLPDEGKGDVRVEPLDVPSAPDTP